MSDREIRSARDRQGLPDDVAKLILENARLTDNLHELAAEECMRYMQKALLSKAAWNYLGSDPFKQIIKKYLTVFLMLLPTIGVCGEPEFWFAPPTQDTSAEIAAQWRMWTSRCGKFHVYGRLVSQNTKTLEIKTLHQTVKVNRGRLSKPDLQFLRQCKELFPDALSERRKVKAADIARQIQEMKIEEAEFKQLQQQRCVITKRGRIS